MRKSNSSLENSTGLPLCKRGIEGDLAGPELAATVKSPLAPLLQRGEYLNLSGFKPSILALCMALSGC